MKSRVLSALLASVLAVTLASCGDDDPPSEETTSPSGEQSPDSDDESPDTEDTEDTEEPASESPSVTPAAGPLVDNDAVSFHLFEHADWIHVTDRSLVDGWLLVLDEGNVHVSLAGSESRTMAAVSIHGIGISRRNSSSPTPTAR